MSGSMATQVGRPRGRDNSWPRGDLGSAEWVGMLSERMTTLTQISAENQQAMQQLLTKTGQMVSRETLEDILDKRFMDRQESELLYKPLERRVEQVENQLRVQPAITRSWLMLLLTGGGCAVSLLSIFTSVLMALLIFGLQQLIH